MRYLVGVLLVLTTFLSGVQAGAQQEVPVPIGTLLRIESPTYSGKATLTGLRRDSLQLVVEGLQSPLAVPVSSITRLNQRRPATALERITRGAIWGFGVMGVLGVAVSYATPVAAMFAESIPEDPSRAQFVLLSASGGAMWGAGIGLAIPQSRWDSLNPGRR